MAKPMPCALGLMAVLMPIASPRTLHSGPPELPKLIERVGLDEVLEGGRAAEDVERRAALGADDAHRHRAAQLAERVADGDGPVADAQPVGVAQRQHGQVVAVDLEHGDVGLGIGAHHLGLEGALVVEGDGDGLGVGDHVVVGQDVAVAVDDEARAGRGHDPRPLRRRLAEEAAHEVVLRGQGRRRHLLLHLDEDHGRQRLLDDRHERALETAAEPDGGGLGAALRGGVTLQVERDAQAEADDDAGEDEDGAGEVVAARAGERLAMHGVPPYRVSSPACRGRAMRGAGDDTHSGYRLDARGCQQGVNCRAGGRARRARSIAVVRGTSRAARRAPGGSPRGARLHCAP